MKDQGFTLIELLVVIAVIGVLAVIAIPEYAAHKTQAFDAAAQTDLMNLVRAEEAYFVDNQTYTTNTSVLPGLKLSPNVTVAVTGATASAFTATAEHSNGDTIFTFDSSQSTGGGGTTKKKKKKK